MAVHDTGSLSSAGTMSDTDIDTDGEEAVEESKSAPEEEKLLQHEVRRCHFLSTHMLS